MLSDVFLEELFDMDLHLDKKEPFIFRLVEILSQKMGEAFPEIKTQKQLIENVIKEEEHSFLRTLDQGLLLLNRLVNNAKGNVISGDKAFELYDTYGFPLDLTSLILKEKGMSLEVDAFELEMQKQKNRSKSASQVSTDDWTVLFEDDVQEFIGYDALEAKVKISRYRKVVSKKEGTLFQLVFNLTPFYPEGGGQVGDKGYIESSNGDVTYILDTKKENNVIIHLVKELPNHLDSYFTAIVDEKQRLRTSSNHTATIYYIKL